MRNVSFFFSIFSFVFSINAICQISKTEIFPDTVSKEFSYVFKNSMPKETKYKRFKMWAAKRGMDDLGAIIELDDPESFKVIIKGTEPLNIIDSYYMNDFDVSNAYSISESEKKFSYKLDFECKEDRCRLKFYNMNRCYLRTLKVITGKAKGNIDVKYVNNYDIVAYCNTNSDFYNQQIDMLNKRITPTMSKKEKASIQSQIHTYKHLIELQPEKDKTKASVINIIHNIITEVEKELNQNDEDW